MMKIGDYVNYEVIVGSDSYVGLLISFDEDRAVIWSHENNKPVLVPLNQVNKPKTELNFLNLPEQK